MEFAVWATVCGSLLIFMALGGSLLSRLPLSTSMVYLLAGLCLGPLGFALAAPHPVGDAKALERLTEVVVVYSLFTSGLKMSAGLHDRRWLAPVRLAVVSMVVTVALIAFVGVLWLGLPLGAAVLLGGILAPTDPVLASDVQLADPNDRDALRYALTGEGGLNDGTAFPFVFLGLGLLGVHEIGSYGWRWVAVDVLWASGVGLAIGALLGACVGRLVLYLRQAHREAVGYDNFLALGLVALAYGSALLMHAAGFLAAFAAGVALRHVEHTATARAAQQAGAKGSTSAESTELAEQANATADLPRCEALATHPQHASAFMAHAVLSFNEQIDRLGEFTAVLVLGLLLWAVTWPLDAWWFVPLLLLAIRPVAVAIGLAGTRTSATQKRLIGWFGIRGIGSLYYLFYAINHGLPAALTDQIVGIAATVIVTSIVAHGISVTPLMNRYRGEREGGPAEAADRAAD